VLIKKVKSEFDVLMVDPSLREIYCSPYLRGKTRINHGNTQKTEKQRDPLRTLWFNFGCSAFEKS
jgi:hypothetical protein